MSKNTIILISAFLALASTSASADNSIPFYGITTQRKLQQLPNHCKPVLQNSITQVSRKFNVAPVNQEWVSQQGQNIIAALKNELKKQGYQGGVEFHQTISQISGGQINGKPYISILWSDSAIGLKSKCK